MLFMYQLISTCMIYIRSLTLYGVKVLITLYLILQEGDSTNLLFTVFLGCMILGAILMCFLSKRDDKLESLPGQASIGSILKSVIAPLLEARVWLIIPLLAYSGLEQAFVW